MSGDTDVSFELDLSEPSKELLLWAKENIGEESSKREHTITELKRILIENNHLHARTEESYLVRYLRRHHFCIDDAYKMILNYHKFRSQHPEIFRGFNLAYLTTLGEADIISVLPYKEQTGRRILLNRCGKWNMDIHPVEAIFQALILLLEIGAMEQQAQILGGICVIDLDGLTLHHAKFCTPRTVKIMIQIGVMIYPLKLHAVHIVNEPSFFFMMYRVIKLFLPNDLKQRLFIHGNNWESFHKHISPQYLPKRYGGLHQDYSCDEWIKSCLNNPTFIEEFQALGYFTQKDIEELSLKFLNLS